MLQRLRVDARHLAGRFGLPLLRLDAERPQVRRRYGICYEDGSIRIRLRHVTTGRLLRYSSLVDTLCHELAHLRHFDHSPRFYACYRRILVYARQSGIYRPRPRQIHPAPSVPAPAPGPGWLRRADQGGEQLELF